MIGKRHDGQPKLGLPSRPTFRIRTTMSFRTEVLILDRTLPSERLDTYLRSKFPAVSRGAIQRLIEEGHIRVDGRTVKPTHTPRAGETVEVHWPEARPAEAQPEEMPMDILHEDDA